MNFRIILCSILIVSAMLSSGCSTEVPSRMMLPSLQIGRSRTAPVIKKGEVAPLVAIEDFSDARESEPLVFGMNRVSMPETSNVGPHVSDALTEEMLDLGFSVTESAPLLITGEVRTWKALVSNGLPSKVVADALFLIKVIDTTNKVVYSAAYRGFSSFQALAVGYRDMQYALGKAMQEAIRQLSHDPDLVSLLTSY